MVLYLPQSSRSVCGLTVFITQQNTLSLATVCVCVRTYVCVTGSRVVRVSLPCRKCFQVAPPVMIRVNKDRGSEGLAYPPTAAPRPLRFFFFFFLLLRCFVLSSVIWNWWSPGVRWCFRGLTPLFGRRCQKQ